MNLKEALLGTHSKQQVVRIARHIGSNGSRFSELVGLIAASEGPVSQRAAWAMSYCTESHPSLVKPHLEQLIRLLAKPVHVGVKRNIVRILQFIDIPEELMGIVADECFRLLGSGEESIAVKAFSMTVLANICRKEPDLGKELKLLIEAQLPHASAGLRARSRQILKQLG